MSSDLPLLKRNGLLIVNLLMIVFLFGMTDEEVDVESTEAVVQHVYTQHSSLLGKGLALSHLPTVHEALEGNLPIR